MMSSVDLLAQKSETTYLSICSPVPPTIRPGDTTTVLQIDQGQNASLVCAASGIPAPNITWTKSDGGFLPVGYAQFRVSQSVVVLSSLEFYCQYWVKGPQFRVSQSVVVLSSLECYCQFWVKGPQFRVRQSVVVLSSLQFYCQFWVKRPQFRVSQSVVVLSSLEFYCQFWVKGPQFRVSQSVVVLSSLEFYCQFWVKGQIEFLLICYFFYICLFESFVGNSAHVTWVWLQQPQEQCCPFLPLGAIFLRVSRQWCGCQCLGFSMCSQMLMHVIAHRGGCSDTVRESASTESWLREKKSLAALGLKPASVLRLAFQSDALPVPVPTPLSQPLGNVVCEKKGLDLCEKERERDGEWWDDKTDYWYTKYQLKSSDLKK